MFYCFFFKVLNLYSFYLDDEKNLGVCFVMVNVNEVYDLFLINFDKYSVVKLREMNVLIKVVVENFW